jgi:AraC family transcriptional regulator, regulatory protein of adaptative response / methylated-DNA-[protein]-cysteine methyltransferase
MEKQEEQTQIDEQQFWQAVVDRDPRYSGKFFYGVRSTGIYCRPDCPSRRPKREMVAFFLSLEDAEESGYRACKRCNPKEIAGPVIERVTRACLLIEKEGAISLSELSRRLDVSPYHLQRTFKAVTGVSPRQYAAGLRGSQLKDHLRDGMSVSSAQYEAGYGSSSRLYEDAKSRMGMTPGTYQKGGKDMNIRFSIVPDSMVGKMLVASTDRGICALSFGDTEEELIRSLAAEFPSADITRDDESVDTLVRPVLEHLAGRRPRLDLPLDVQATAFQRLVWEELRRIPYGETRTYTQVAGAVGKPGAVRAVASACAKNPAALVTPCHRVVRSDGSLAGYRWGIQRKEALLHQEKMHRA